MTSHHDIAAARRRARLDEPPRLAVRLHPAAALRDASIAARHVEQLARDVAPELVAAGSARPLFDTVDPKVLDELVARAVRTDPTYRPADFHAWYQIDLSGFDPDATHALVRRLAARDEIDTAHLLQAGPPPVVAIDDPRSADQGYLDPAPDGIDARFAWNFPGGDGAGTAYVDLEQGWDLAHEDLVAAGITLISGTSAAYPEHGTSVLGEISMTDNTTGGVGIAPAASARVVSQHQPGGYNTPGAILSALAVMAFGDVLLLEAQETDPVGGQYYWPVEIADASYEAIRLGTALGITVVEAACNGGYDLDAYTNLSGRRIFDRTSPDFRDSGAVMVGAGSAAAPHSRLGFSNHGNRVDCYGWGESIDTATTDAAGTDHTAYTSYFGGTSGASPIVVGAALAVQGLAQQSLGYRLAPPALRRMLVRGGTPSAAPASDRIGVMPNLRAIIEDDELNLAADVYLRDYVGDSGDPTSGGVSASPDIIVRQAPVADPDAAFGEGSGTENDPTLSQDVGAGSDHSVYVRLRNRGAAVAADTAVDVYWSPPSTLVTPNLWQSIGTIDLPAVPVGDVLTVGGPLTWPAAALPTPGHYCFVAVAGDPTDPRPHPAAFPTWDDYLAFVRNQNNVAWRNFNVVPAPPDAGVHEFAFVVPGAFDLARVFAVEALGRLPRGSKARLVLPHRLAKELRLRAAVVSDQVDRDRLAVPLNAFGRTRLGRGPLSAGSLAECTLAVQVPEWVYDRPGRYEFALRQLYQGQEVGRLTWRFGAPTKVD